MKNKIAIFCMIVFSFFFVGGCSKDKISEVQIVDDTIKTEYIIGETVEIKQFKLKLVRNKKEEIYDVNEDMINYDTIDNTIKGNQKIDINVKYNEEIIKVSVGIEFKLPDKVSGIITLIEELPDPKNITFSDEEQINLIYSSITTLNEFYKGYIDNIDKLEKCKEKIDLLYTTYITPDFLNDRFVLKTNLDNLFYSLKETDYSEDNWNNIVRIYDSSISNLYLNKNHNIIKVIVNGAMIQIYKIKTIDQQAAEVLRVERVKNLVDYRNTLTSNDYSSQSLLILDEIEREYMDKLNKADSCEIIENLFNEALDKFIGVDTLVEENAKEFALEKEKKLEEVRNVRLNINLNIYSNENRKLIVDYYNMCLENIRNFNTIADIDNEITKFKNKISLMKTAAEEEQELIYNEKKRIILEINQFYNSINIYEYDTQNRDVISHLVEEALNDVDYALTLIELEEIKDSLIANINDLPTMIEQAEIYLVTLISNAKKELDNYVEALSFSDYTSDNWNDIKNIVTTAKNKLDTEIDVSTHTRVIEDIVLSAKNEINEVNTIKEEEQNNLISTKSNSINRLEEYSKSLTINDFENDEMFNISKNRITSAVSVIRSSSDIDTIIKLTEDTINSIEDAKSK